MSRRTDAAADPTLVAFRRDVLDGLARTPRAIPCKYFYDKRGSELFDRITRLDAYYPTRTEQAILRVNGDAMAAAIGPDAVLIEYGSGSSVKTRALLDRLPDLAAYVPVDISAEHLFATAGTLRREYPHLRIEPVAADYTADDFQLPDDPDHRRKRVVYFPGSTIGNFNEAEARAFLRHATEVVGPGGGLLIGVDLRKDRALLERAYDDEEGVTAAFNLNLLARINRELAGTFDLGAWRHRAVWNEADGRVELYLVSMRDQTATVAGVPFSFHAGETIHTEHAHKYTLDGFADLAASTGWRLRHRWLDDGGLFSVQYLEAIP